MRSSLPSPGHKVSLIARRPLSRRERPGAFMVAFQRYSPFNHRPFSHRQRIVPSPSSYSSPSSSKGSPSSRGLSSSTLDSKLSKQRNSTYPIYLVAAFLVSLLLLALCNTIYRLNIWFAKRRKHRHAPEGSTPYGPSLPYDKPYSEGGSSSAYETGLAGTQNRRAAQRFVAAVNALRIVAFRKTRVSLFKVLVICLYLLLCLGFLVANSKLSLF